MSSDRFDNKQNLPPWLRDVPLPPRPRDADERPAASAHPPADEPLPDWLRDASAESSPAADAPSRLSGEGHAPQIQSQESLPAWMRDTQPAMSESPGASQDLPDWLSSISPSEPPPAASPAPATPQPAEDLPDWLRESQRDVAPTAQTPDWLSDISEPAQSAPEPDAGAVPDWLRNLASEPSAAASPDAPAFRPTQSDAAPPADEPLPGWLRDSGERPEPSPFETTEMPGWLLESDAASPSAPTPTEPAPPSRGSQPADDAGVPDWLGSSSRADEGDAISIEPFSFEGMGGPHDNEPAAGPPAWLASDAEDTDALDVSVPDWLKDTTGSSGAAPAAPDMPGWLQGSGATPEAAPAEPPRFEPPAAPAPGEQESLPPWLRDTGASQPPAADVPAWLQESQPSAPAPAEDVPAPAEDVPPWLRGDEPAQAPPAADVPAWLQESQPSAPAPAENVPPWLRDAASAQPPPSADVPAWLQENQPSAPAPAEDVPPWLRGDEPAQPPPAADVPVWSQESQTPAPPPAEDVPDWLRDSQPAAPFAEDAPASTGLPEPPAVPRAEPEDTMPGMAPPADLPDWLRPTTPTPAAQTDLPPWLHDEAGQPLPTAGAQGDTNLPAWLRGAPIDSPSVPPAAPPEKAAPAGFDWFDDEEQTHPSAQPAPAASASDLVGGIELPAWLRPPEPEPQREINPSDARSLDWLTRLGGHEEEEVAAPVAVPQVRLAPPPAPVRSQAHLEALALLERLAAEPFPAPAPLPQVTPSIWRRLAGERLLYLALLAAIVVALMLPVAGPLGLTVPPSAPGASDLFAQIDRLSENDIVLVGYEWDARRSGELRPLEQAVMDHLAQRRVKMVLVSTDPQGTLLLFDARDRLAQAGYHGSGQDYVLLGYRPGAELALRSLAQDFRGALRSDFQGDDATVGALARDAQTGQARLNSLGDLAMVLVMADEPSDVQGWMEQTRRSAKKSDGSFVPFAFLLPAETAPIVQPYLGQSVYHLAGKSGALAYQSLRGAQTAQIATEAGQQRLGLLVYVVLFLVGGIFVGLGSAVDQGRKRT